MSREPARVHPYIMRTLSAECQVLTPPISGRPKPGRPTRGNSEQVAPQSTALVGKHAYRVAMVATEERGRQPYAYPIANRLTEQTQRLDRTPRPCD